jgi:hypothetical protein
MKPEMAVSEDACMNAESSFGKLQNMGAKHRFKLFAQPLVHLNVLIWRYI